MSFVQIKREVRNFNAKQRHELAALLAEIADRDDEENVSAEIARRHARMDAGEKFTLGDLKRRHDELTAKGR